MMNKSIFILFTTLAFTACATPQTTAYFTLPDSRFVMPEHRIHETTLRVELAEPFNQGGLVYQAEANRLHHARHHLWAQPLENALSARFANELNRHQGQVVYVPLHQSQAQETAIIYIEAFNGNYQGYAHVQGYIRFSNARVRNFNVQVPQQGDGYEAMLEALSQGISQAIQQID